VGDTEIKATQLHHIPYSNFKGFLFEVLTDLFCLFFKWSGQEDAEQSPCTVTFNLEWGAFSSRV